MALLSAALAGCPQPADDEACQGDDVVRGLVASETQGLFEDSEVRDVFEAEGIEVCTDPMGSIRIGEPGRLRRGHYDFAFPGSDPAADNITRSYNDARRYRPFYSPMAIATFESIVDILAVEGLAQQAADGTWRLDLAAFLEWARQPRPDGPQPGRWDHLGHNGYRARRDILVSTTDPRQSNSGFMYMALVRQLTDPGAVVDLFARQGYMDDTSRVSFNKYLRQGTGFAPLLFVYEGLFLEQLMRSHSRIVFDGDDPRSNMVLVYPTPSILSNHTLVALNSDGRKVGALLEGATLQTLAAEHGFRTSDPRRFDRVVEQGLPDDFAIRTESFDDSVNPPAYEELRRLTLALGDALGEGG